MPPAVTSTDRPAERSSLGVAHAEEHLDPIGDLPRLGHPAHADEPLGQLPVGRPHDLRATLDEEGEVRLRRRVLPHRRVHRGRDQERASVRKRRLREQVVREPVREPRERVRGQRSDDEHIGADEVGIRVGGRALARQRPERLGRHEPLGAPRRDRRDVVPRADEQTHELARLVGGDASVTPTRIRATCTLCRWRSHLSAKRTRGRGLGKPGGFPSYCLTLSGKRTTGRGLGKPGVSRLRPRLYDAGVSYAKLSLPRAISSIAIVR